MHATKNMTDFYKKALLNDKGLSLIELAMAALLFAIVIGGMSYVFTIVPTQRSYHMNALVNDICKLSYSMKNDISRAIEISKPSWPGSSSSSDATLVMTINDNSSGAGGRSHVEYKAYSEGAQMQVGRCIKPCSTLSCDTDSCDDNDFIDLLSSWDDGYVGLTGSGSGVWRGIDVDGNGLSDKEKDIIHIVLVLGQFEGGRESAKQEIGRKTFVFESSLK